MIIIILKNILSFIKNHKTVFILFFISQIITILSIMTIYGLYSMPVKMDQEYDDEIRAFEVTLNEYGDEFYEKINDFSSKHKKDLRSLTVELNTPEETILAQCFPTWQASGKYYMEIGKYLSDSAFQYGEKEAIISQNANDDSDIKKKIGDKFTFNGTEYIILGTSRSDFTEVTFSSLEKSDYKFINSFKITLADVPSSSQVEQWEALIFASFGEDAIVTMPEKTGINQLSENSLQGLIAGVVALMAVLNIAYLYRYILEQRRQLFGINMLFGCSQKQARMLLLGECLIYTSSIYILSGLIFHFMLTPFVLKASMYSYKLALFDYVLIFIIYTIITLTVFAFINRSYSKRSIRQLLLEE